MSALTSSEGRICSANVALRSRSLGPAVPDEAPADAVAPALTVACRLIVPVTEDAPDAVFAASRTELTASAEPPPVAEAVPGEAAAALGELVAAVPELAAPQPATATAAIEAIAPNPATRPRDLTAPVAIRNLPVNVLLSRLFAVQRLC
jgi:hypothetical protein